MKKMLFSVLSLVLGFSSMFAETATLVTSTEQLADGDQIIITAASTAKAISTENNENNRKSVDITFSDDKSTVTYTDGAMIDGAMIFKVGTSDKGTTGYTYTFETTNYLGNKGYMGNTDTGSNYCTIGSSLATGRYASIAISDGTATITFDTKSGKKGKKNTLLCNTNGTPLFGCYVSSNISLKGYELVRIYKLGEVGPVKPAPTMSWSPSTAEAIIGEEFTGPELTTDPTGLDITYSSSNTGVASIDANGKVTIVGVGTTTITASFAGNDTYSAKSASYTLTVKAATIKSIKEFYAGVPKGSSAEVEFPMTVAYVNYRYCYAYDSKGDFTLIYGSSDIKDKYTPGDILPTGWTGTHSSYKNTPQISVSTTPGDRTGTTTFTPAKVNAAFITADNVNHVVILQNVSFDAATSSSKNDVFTGKVDNTDVKFVNYFETEGVPAGKYDVQLSIFVNENNEVVAYPISYTQISALDNVVLTWSASEVNARLGEEVTLPTLTVTPEKYASVVKYTSSNTQVAEISANGEVTIKGAGSTRINADVAQTAENTAANASYQLTVIDPNIVTLTATFDFTTKDPYGMTSTTSSNTRFRDLTFTDPQTGVKMHVDEKFVHHQGNANGNPLYDLRLYTGSTATITAPLGYEVMNIEITKSQIDTSLGINGVTSFENNRATLWTRTDGLNESVSLSATAKSFIGTVIVTVAKLPEVMIPLYEDTQATMTVGQTIQIVPQHYSHTVIYATGTKADFDEYATKATKAAARAVADDAWTQHDVVGGKVPYTLTALPTAVLAKAVDRLGNVSDVHAIYIDTDGSSVTGIEGVGADEASSPVRYYTLQGVEVAGKPAAGLYIRVQGGKATKVAVTD